MWESEQAVYKLCFCLTTICGCSVTSPEHKENREWAVHHRTVSIFCAGAGGVAKDRSIHYLVQRKQTAAFGSLQLRVAKPKLIERLAIYL